MFYDVSGLFQNGNLTHIYGHKMHGKVIHWIFLGGKEDNGVDNMSNKGTHFFLC